MTTGECKAFCTSNPKERLREQVVAQQDEDGGGDDRIRRGLADALCAALAMIAVVAAHQRDDEAEDAGFDDTGHHIVPFQEVPGVIDVG